MLQSVPTDLPVVPTEFLNSSDNAVDGPKEYNNVFMPTIEDILAGIPSRSQPSTSSSKGTTAATATQQKSHNVAHSILGYSNSADAEKRLTTVTAQVYNLFSTNNIEEATVLEKELIGLWSQLKNVSCPSVAHMYGLPVLPGSIADPVVEPISTTTTTSNIIVQPIPRVIHPVAHILEDINSDDVDIVASPAKNIPAPKQGIDLLAKHLAVKRQASGTIATVPKVASIRASPRNRAASTSTSSDGSKRKQPSPTASGKTKKRKAGSPTEKVQATSIKKSTAKSPKTTTTTKSGSNIPTAATPTTPAAATNIST